MNRIRLIAFTVFSSIFINGSAFALTAEEVAGKLSSAPVIEAGFTQTRILKGASKPLVSRGAMTAVRGEGVLWDQVSPFSERVTVAREKITIEREGEKPEVLTASANPEAFSFSRLMMGLMSGDLSGIRSSFTIASVREEKGGGWRMDLRPKARRLKAAFRGVSLSGDTFVKRIDIESQSGENSSIAFTGARESDAIPQEARTRLGR